MSDLLSSFERASYWCTEDSFYKKMAELPGELRLCEAVLFRTRDDLIEGMRSRELRQKYDFDGALEWVKSDDEHWKMSFVNVCAVLGLDHRAVRKKILSSIKLSEIKTPKPKTKVHFVD